MEPAIKTLTVSDGKFMLTLQEVLVWEFETSL